MRRNRHGSLTRTAVLTTVLIMLIGLAACEQNDQVDTQDPGEEPADQEGDPDDDVAAEVPDCGEFVYAFSAPVPEPQLYTIVGQEMGFFDEEGLTVTIEVAPDTNAAVRTGEVDMGTGSGEALLRIHGEDPEADLVSFFSYTPQYHGVYTALADSGLESIEDLVGQTVGTPSLQFAAYETARAELRSLGHDPDEVVWEVTPDAAVQAQALEQGTIDALVTVDVLYVGVEDLVEGELVQLEHAPGFEVMPGPVIIATEEQIEGNFDCYVAFARGFIKAWAFVDENLEAATDILVSRFPEMQQADESRMDAIERASRRTGIRHENQQVPDWADDDRYGITHTEAFELLAEVQEQPDMDVGVAINNDVVAAAWENLDLEDAREQARQYEIEDE